MQLNSISVFRAGLFSTGFCLIVSAACGHAGDVALRDLLRDGLFAEEVSRDPDTAAKRYEELLTRYDEDRDFAASALFRLAEVRRKQDRKEDAIMLYQRLLLEFPMAADETKLARENLVTLGVKPSEMGNVAKPGVVDREAEEVARLRGMAKTSPDALVDPLTFRRACDSGWAGVIRLMLDAGCDPFSGDALQGAARSGNLEIVRILLAENKPVPRPIAKAAFEGAIDSSRLAVLRFLLEKGLEPGNLQGPAGEIPALLYVLRTGNLKAADVLVEGGEGIDVVSEFRIPDKEGVVRGRALQFAILHQRYEMAAWLLEKGAKPEVPGAGESLTPLHCALESVDEDCFPLIEPLLAGGADPNASTSYFNKNSDGREGRPALAIAITSRFKPEEKTALLLKHGAKPAGSEKQLGNAVMTAVKEGQKNTPSIVGKLIDAGASAKELDLFSSSVRLQDLSLAKLLLEHGVDPNLKRDDLPPALKIACEGGRSDLLKLLLDAGAVPEPPVSEDKDFIRMISMRSDRRDEIARCLELLADAGARPGDKWADDGYQGARAEAMPLLIERFVIPHLAAEGCIGFVQQTAGSLNVKLLSEGGSTGQPPRLERWLLAQGPTLQFARMSGTMPERHQWQLWRKSDGGKFVVTELDFSGSEPLPDLLAGDVILCRLFMEGTGRVDYVTGLPPEMQLALRKRISFPITVEHQGKNRMMTLRGDRVVFDPTKDELPLASAQDVVTMLWQTSDFPAMGPIADSPMMMDIKEPGNIVIQRKDWPEVRLRYGSREADGFQLEAGDHLKVEFSNEFLQGLERYRSYSVTIRVEGHPLTRRYAADSGKNPGILAPTLIQALVDMQVPYDPLWWKGLQAPGGMEWPELTGADKIDTALLARTPQAFRNFTLFPHPDLSRISIRRMQDGGEEKIIEVDLAEAIDFLTDGMTAEEVRKMDVDLRAGDIVDIRLKQEKLGEPWKGFTEREARFFSLALSGQVQMVDVQGGVSFAEIDVRPPNYVATDLGLLPVPSAEGQPSTRARWFLNGGTGEAVTRGGVRDKMNAASIFLRGGDELRVQMPSRQSSQHSPAELKRGARPGSQRRGEAR